MITDLHNFLLTNLGEYIGALVWILLKIVAIVLPLIIAMAYLTLMERKVIAAMQMRKGPNVVGPFGLLQPFADGVKLMSKELILPTESNKALFILAPVITFTLAMVGWAVIPFDAGLVLADINVGVLYLLAISSLGVYGIIIAGWASNSKYPFLGAIRSAAQMVSYEVSIGLVIITVLLCAGSLNLSAIVNAQKGMWYIIPLFPMFVIFFISILAETNRHPFDLPEAEAELVAGYNVEYSSMIFAMFFLGEYMNMILMSANATILFLGGWLPPLASLAFIPGPIWFALKIVMCLFVFIWARATLPRYRYDQLMRLGWKVFLPLSLLGVVAVAGVLVYFNWLPEDNSQYVSRYPQYPAEVAKFIENAEDCAHFSGEIAGNGSEDDKASVQMTEETCITEKQSKKTIEKLSEKYNNDPTIVNALKEAGTTFKGIK